MSIVKELVKSKKAPFKNGNIAKMKIDISTDEWQNKFADKTNGKYF